ncbi:MAG TPA: DNA primase small subunit PriS, partial [Halobacteriales archaeon]|nr:DNA primase small subunit PriS [Halobacteriales archaeon]
DFAFDDLTVVFSGSRGYHVHVRDPELRTLSREARREVVDYVRGIDVAFEALLATETVAGMGRKTPTEKRTLRVDGGWGGRVHDHVVAYVDELLAMDHEDSLGRLQSFDGIGPGKAESALTAARNNYEQIAAGNVDVHPAFFSLARKLTEETVEAESAAIDEPVTTDTHRLIRLPGSLHGGSGLRVTPISLDELDDFDPLVDAVPEAFTGHEIAVRGDGGPPVEVGGQTFTVPADVIRLPEYAGVFLMARGRAEKEKE